MITAILFFTLFTANVPPQNNSPQTAFKCSQPAAEQNPLLREAIEQRYTVRRVEFIGNETIRDYVLRRQVFLQEGNFFRRRDLSRSLTALNRLKLIYPLTLEDVIVQLDKQDKVIDMTFCFRERHQRR